VDGSDVQLITSGLSGPMGIDIHDNEIYFTEYQRGKIYKQAKSPGSSNHFEQDSVIVYSTGYSGIILH
jgi:hypothetical protein